MKSDQLTWLARPRRWTWHTAQMPLRYLNATAVVALLMTRDRSLMGRWSPRWLTANLTPLGVGVGGPRITVALRFVVSTLPDVRRSAARIRK